MKKTMLSIEAVYASPTHSMLHSVRFSQLPLPPSLEHNGEILTLFTPACGPKSLLRIEEDDLVRLKQPYDVFYKGKGIVYIKGQKIKTELIGITGQADGILYDRYWKRIGTWDPKTLTFTLDK